MLISVLNSLQTFQLGCYPLFFFWKLTTIATIAKKKKEIPSTNPAVAMRDKHLLTTVTETKSIENI